MPIIARKTVERPVQEYTGEIVEAKIASNPRASDGKRFDYVNLVIQTDETSIEGWDGRFKTGMPANLSAQTELGRLLNRLGMAIPTVGQSFDEQSLVGQRVVFDTKREGYFTNVVNDSIHAEAE